MKDYYLFSKDGDDIKISQNNIVKYIVFSINKEALPQFTKDSLIKQLEDFISYLKKYG
jgi:hypothetical protein